jgi:hypothetical protein
MLVHLSLEFADFLFPLTAADFGLLDGGAVLGANSMIRRTELKNKMIN